DAPPEDWARDLIAAGTGPERVGILSPLRRSEQLRRPTLLVIQPIQGGGDRPLGFFVERLDLRELADVLITPSTDLAPSFWLLDKDGGVLVRGGVLMSDPGSERLPVPTE